MTIGLATAGMALTLWAGRGLAEIVCGRVVMNRLEDTSFLRGRPRFYGAPPRHLTHTGMAAARFNPGFGAAHFIMASVPQAGQSPVVIRRGSRSCRPPWPGPWHASGPPAGPPPSGPP